jgi:hypothetical protein
VNSVPDLILCEPRPEAGCGRPNVERLMELLHGVAALRASLKKLKAIAALVSSSVAN